MQNSKRSVTPGHGMAGAQAPGLDEYAGQVAGRQSKIATGQICLKGRSNRFAGGGGPQASKDA
jgi:hypothetical protein